jgi:poly(3-hydroxyalkanoate) depolymerase
VLHQLQIGSYNVRVAVWHGDVARTPILLFNGIGGNFELLAPLVEALGDVEVISFDIPGVGGSLLPPFIYRLPAMARLAVKVLRRIGHQRADVIGVSWGGALAQQFAHTAPSRCRRLVLCCTTSGALLSWPATPAVMLKLLTPARYLRRTTMQRDAGRLYGGRFRWDQSLIRDYISRIHKPSKLGYLLQIGAISGWTSALWLWRLRQPTLVMAGADDPIVPPINAHILARLIPHSRLEILDEGHLFVITQPELSARVIREFLDTEHPDPISPRPWSEAMHSADS